MKTSDRAASVSGALLFALPWIAPLAPSASAQQEVLIDIPGVHPGAEAEYPIPIGDWDGDGVEDLAIGAPRDDTRANMGGAFRIHSGKDGSVLAKKIMAQSGAQFGFPLARLPDIDGDGIDDLAVAAPNYDYLGPGKGSLFLYSGTTNHLLLRIDAEYGAVYPMGPLGDVDGDGICDLYVARQGAPEVVYVYSCADGHQITKFTQNNNEYFGTSVSALDDLDGDGVNDLLIGAPDHEDASHRLVGAAYVISTATGVTLRSHFGTLDNEFLGWKSAALSDFDGDGVRDYAVLAVANGVTVRGMFFVYSGATGAQIANVLPPSSNTSFQGPLFDAGDVNGDGARDVVVNGQWFDAGNVGRGAAFVFSGKTWLEIGRVQVDDPILRLGPPLDLDRDGRSDLVIGTAEPSLDGRVRVYSGDDLFLIPNPMFAASGDTLDLSTAEGVPNGLTILALESVDGVPTFQLIDGLGFFDGVGHRVVSKTVPSGLAGHVLKFRAYSRDAAGHVIQSSGARVWF